MEDLPRATDDVVLNAPPPSIDTEPEEETTMKTEPTDESDVTVKVESTDLPVKPEPTDVKIEKIEEGEEEEEEEEEEEDTQPSFLSSRSNSISQRTLTPEEEEKVRAIAAACEAGDREKVVEAAITKDGLICDRVRREAWPFLLGSRNSTNGSLSEKRRDWRDLPPHVDEDQVKLDVNRSFIYYPTNMTPRQLEQRKKQLLELIVEVLRRHPMLGYFQGFHDVCQLILLVLGPVLAVPAVEHIALLRIRDFMLPEMAPAIDHLFLLYPLLKAEHPKLCAHISNTQPFFALAATLTLYAHEIQEYSNIARLFDAFLALDPVFPLYLFAQIIISRSTELFSIPEDEPEMLHSILSHLPKPLDLETWITQAIQLLKSRPPESLSYWHCVSYLSVLKTSKKHSSLKEAEILFKKHCRQLEFRKKKKEVLVKLNKNKGTVLFVGVSVLVGVGGVVWGVWGRRMGIAAAWDMPGVAILWGLVKAVRAWA